MIRFCKMGALIHQRSPDIDRKSSKDYKSANSIIQTMKLCAQRSKKSNKFKGKSKQFFHRIWSLRSNTNRVMCSHIMVRLMIVAIIYDMRGFFGSPIVSSSSLPIFEKLILCCVFFCQDWIRIRLISRWKLLPISPKVILEIPRKFPVSSSLWRKDMLWHKAKRSIFDFM